MNKKGLIIALIIVFVLTGGLAVYFYTEDKKKKKKIDELEKDNLKLLLESIKGNHNLSEEIRRQLIKLVRQFQDIYAKVANEIAQAIQLLKI